MTTQPDELLDPYMKADDLRLHMGELTANEVLVARAAIRWANTRATPRIDDQVDVEAFKKLIVAADFLHEAISECRVADDQYSDAFEAWLKYKLVRDQITAHYNLTRKGD